MFSSMESSHVTFDEYRFPGAPKLESIMDEEYQSDSELTADQARDSDELSAEYDDMFFAISSLNGVTGSSAIQLHEGPDNKDVIWKMMKPLTHWTLMQAVMTLTLMARTFMTVLQKILTRYPRRARGPPSQWYIPSSAKGVSATAKTTIDDPKLKEAFGSTAEEQELKNSAIHEEFDSLKENQTWT